MWLWWEQVVASEATLESGLVTEEEVLLQLVPAWERRRGLLAWRENPLPYRTLLRSQLMLGPSRKEEVGGLRLLVTVWGSCEAPRPCPRLAARDKGF